MSNSFLLFQVMNEILTWLHFIGIKRIPKWIWLTYYYYYYFNFRSNSRQLVLVWCLFDICLFVNNFWCENSRARELIFEIIIIIKWRVSLLVWDLFKNNIFIKKRSNLKEKCRSSIRMINSFRFYCSYFCAWLHGWNQGHIGLFKND